MTKIPDVKDIARKYISLSNAVDYNGMADLFDEQAEWIPISSVEPRIGREAIRAGYLDQVKSHNRPIINDRYFADGLTCVVEFEVDLGGNQTASIVDIFTFNSLGKIVRLSVYRK